MKQRVALSTYSWIANIICFYLNLFFIFFNQPPRLIQLLLTVLLVVMSTVSLFYMPISISADKDTIYVNRSLKIKTIPMTIRICGSGGFFGYWGWFKERDLGKYFAYYGRLSEFLLFLLPHRWFIGHH